MSRGAGGFLSQNISQLGQSQVRSGAGGMAGASVTGGTSQTPILKSPFKMKGSPYKQPVRKALRTKLSDESINIPQTGVRTTDTSGTT